jgi:tetratricopeptide (TPR) repeat protein
MTGRRCVLFFLLASSASAQFDQPLAKSGQPLQEVKVHIALTNGETCDSSIRVLLIGVNGPVDAGLINNQCVAEFSNVPVGTYRLTVSGRDFPAVDTSVDVDLTGMQDIEVTVKRAGEPGRTGGAPENTLVAAADLRIPASARKQYDKGNQWIGKQGWTKAAERLTQAIAIYPDYAAAYNALGVVYAHLGDRARERESLLKAISINDHFVPAYVNLGRMSIKTGDYRGAETAFSKASALDPTDTATLVLLAYVELQDRHLDEAIAACHKAHSMAPAPHAFAHRVAAYALEQQHKASDARAELQLFLNEEQPGPRAEAARKELAELQTASR